MINAAQRLRDLAEAASDETLKQELLEAADVLSYGPFVVGHRESGGLWISSAACYTHQQAKDIVERDRMNGIKYTHYMRLRPGDPPQLPHGECKGGWRRDGRCTRCGEEV